MRGKEGERVTQVVIGFLSRKGNVRRKKKCCNAMKYARSIFKGVWVPLATEDRLTFRYKVMSIAHIDCSPVGVCIDACGFVFHE